MAQVTYDNVIEILLEKFPEYKNSEQYFDEQNKESHYIILGNLCSMSFEDIDQKLDTILAERLLKLTDEVFNNPDSDDKLINLFNIEVLENLVGSRTGAKLAKQLLHGKSLNLLEQTLKHYNTDEFLNEYRRT